jgi:hypothetical protein
LYGQVRQCLVDVVADLLEDLIAPAGRNPGERELKTSEVLIQDRSDDWIVDLALPRLGARRSHLESASIAS